MSRIPTETEKQVFAELLRYASDCVRYYERIASLPDCNNCGMANNGCRYLPKWGEEVRINCPHWVKEGESNDSN